MWNFKDGNKPFGDWLIQFGIALVAGAIVGISANLWIATYALILGIVLFSVGVRYKYSKEPRRKHR